MGFYVKHRHRIYNYAAVEPKHSCIAEIDNLPCVSEHDLKICLSRVI